jgi:hypothetical protein
MQEKINIKHHGANLIQSGQKNIRILEVCLRQHDFKKGLRPLNPGIFMDKIWGIVIVNEGNLSCPHPDLVAVIGVPTCTAQLL